jgi:chromosome condensin MukBEF ATPase and DNA-binding subunit MukB
VKGTKAKEVTSVLKKIPEAVRLLVEESLNAKIKDFRAQLRGVIDKKFFIFRLVKIFG